MTAPRIAGGGQGWRVLSSIQQIAEAIDDAVDDWHKGAGLPNEPLHSYLGMTEREYARWVETGRFSP